MKPKLAYVGRGALNLLVVVAVLLGVQALVRGHVPDVVGLIILCIAIVAAYLAGVRLIERRPATEFLPTAAPTEFPSGLALGLALFSTVMLVLWILGVYQPSGYGSLTPLAAGFVNSLLAAIVEEILFRGFLFRLIEKLIGLWGALLITSALFGAAHAFNPGATLGSSIAIALEAGLLLGAVYAWKHRLWLPMGLHLGWNFAEGSIFGMSVSGGTVKGSLFLGSLHGRPLLTGGAFGPENSIVAVVVCLALALFLLAKATAASRPV